MTFILFFRQSAFTHSLMEVEKKKQPNVIAQNHRFSAFTSKVSLAESVSTRKGKNTSPTSLVSSCVFFTLPLGILFTTHLCHFSEPNLSRGWADGWLVGWRYWWSTDFPRWEANNDSLFLRPKPLGGNWFGWLTNWVSHTASEDAKRNRLTLIRFSSESEVKHLVKFNTDIPRKWDSYFFSLSGSRQSLWGAHEKFSTLFTFPGRW